MIVVPDQLTPLLKTDALWLIRDGLRTLLGREPSASTVAVLGAQSALETGRWQKIHCQNWGNIKAGDDYPGQVCFFRCNEVINGALRWFDPPHPQTRFRAYSTPLEGCTAWLTFVSSLKRYQAAWQAALSGDPAAYVHGLKLGGYFTADEGAYLRGVMSLFSEFLAVPLVDHAAAQAAVAPDRWNEARVEVYQYREAHGLDPASGLDLRHGTDDSDTC